MLASLALGINNYGEPNIPKMLPKITKSKRACSQEILPLTNIQRTSKRVYSYTGGDAQISMEAKLKLGEMGFPSAQVGFYVNRYNIETDQQTHRFVQEVVEASIEHRQSFQQNRLDYQKYAPNPQQKKSITVKVQSVGDFGVPSLDEEDDDQGPNDQRTLKAYGEGSIAFDQNKKQPFKCPICYDNYLDVYTHIKCGHQFCHECIQTHLATEITEGRIHRIRCPENFCKSVFTDQIVKQFISDEVQIKFERFRKNQEIEMDPLKKWCPRPNCGLYVQYNNQKKMICACTQEICFDCGNMWHQNISCVNAMDTLYKQAIQQFNIKNCPFCKAPIQKTEGCDHMTCFNCSYEFCWLCLRKYTNHHFIPTNFLGCSYPKAGRFKLNACLPPKLAYIFSIIERLIFMLLLIPLGIIFVLLQAVYYSATKPFVIFKDCIRKDSDARYYCDMILMGFSTFLAFPFFFVYFLGIRFYKVILRRFAPTSLCG